MTKIVTDEQIEEIKKALSRRLLEENEVELILKLIEHTPALVKIEIAWRWMLQARAGAIWVAATIETIQFV